MTERYRLQTLQADRGGVKTYQGLDPLTGLPVFIYQFSERPPAALRHLESENIPGVLELRFDGQLGEVIVAYSPEYVPIKTPATFDTTNVLLDSARALRDAAEAGVLHGDITPERFLHADGHVLLEGFGLPWQVERSAFSPPEAETRSYAADVYAWAKSVLFITEHKVPDAAGAILTRCLSVDPEDRPVAAEVYEALLNPSAPVVNAPSVTDTVDDEMISFELTPEEEASANTPPPDAPPVTPEHQATETVDTNDTTADTEQDNNVDTDFLEGIKPAEPTRKSAFDLEIDFNLSPGAAEASDDSHAATQATNMPYSNQLKDTDPDPLVINTDPGLTPPPEKTRLNTIEELNDQDFFETFKKPEPEKPLESAPKEAVTKPVEKAPEPTFIKSLPPGAQFKPGSTEFDMRPGSFDEDDDEIDSSRGRNTRRVLLLLVLLACGGLLAALALTRQNFRTASPQTPASGNLYVINVSLEPANSPPSDLYVISSPAGSSFRPGDGVSKVPGQIVLDKEGTWQLQARFQDRATNIISITVPQERTATLVLPTPEAEETPEEP